MDTNFLKEVKALFDEYKTPKITMEQFKHGNYKQISYQ